MKGTLLRGAARRVVVVKSRDSKLFEEAHFLLREEQTETPLPALLDEANRIVEEMQITPPRRHKGAHRWMFGAGLVAGAALEAAGLLLAYLLK